MTIAAEARLFDYDGFLRSRGIDYGARGGELFFNCPFCNDTRQRLYLNARTGQSYCHDCGWTSNDLGYFISHLTDMSRFETDAFIAGRFQPGEIGDGYLKRLGR